MCKFHTLFALLHCELSLAFASVYPKSKKYCAMITPFKLQKLIHILMDDSFTAWWTNGVHACDSRRWRDDTPWGNCRSQAVQPQLLYHATRYTTQVLVWHCCVISPVAVVVARRFAMKSVHFHKTLTCSTCKGSIKHTQKYSKCSCEDSAFSGAERT